MSYKNIIAGLIFIFFATFTKAQDTASVSISGLAEFKTISGETFVPEWSFGVNGGITVSKISFDTQIRVPQINLQQYTGGLVVRYISENHFGIAGELNYSMRGWKERTDTAYINRYARSLAYIELPVMTQVYFNLGKRIRFLINAGPQISYFLSEKVLEMEDSELSLGKVEESQSRTALYYNLPVQRRFDYGIRGGAGFEFRTGSGSFILDGNYFFGLSDIFNNTRSDTFQASHNQVIGVRLTYLIRKQ
ncbi:MAG: PorT family protein [Dysgonamonadaceae bacterium]|jgi:hypothetical protein|nr:PorT family protein [Dysgonamonadaceae bacterium]